MTRLAHAQALAEIDRARPGPEVGAFFDLDGTLVAGFTAAAFLEERIRRGEIDRRHVGEALRLGFEGVLGRVPFARFLELVLGSLAGRSKAELARLGHELFERELRPRLRTSIVELLFAHRDCGHTVVLATSATSIQADPVAAALGIDRVLCNRLEVDDHGRLTGRVNPPVIWGEGKARAIRDEAQARGIVLAKSFFYADGGEDVSSMYLVGHPRPVHPTWRMRRVAGRRGWPVIENVEEPLAPFDHARA